MLNFIPGFSIFKMVLLTLFFLSGCGNSKDVDSEIVPRAEAYFKPAEDSKPCGPSGSYVSTFIPETWTGFCGRNTQKVLLSDACVQHDFCYVNSDSTKQDCDTLFLEDMKNQCKLAFVEEDCSLSLQACGVVSKAYYDTVAQNGQDAFDKARTPVAPDSAQ